MAHKYEIHLYSTRIEDICPSRTFWHCVPVLSRSYFQCTARFMTSNVTQQKHLRNISPFHPHVLACRTFVALAIAAALMIDT